MKHVVIVGAGFGGIACAKELLRRGIDAQLTLIDQNDYHTIHGNLYEVATSPSDLSSQQELRTTVSIPLSKIFSGQKINLIKAKVDNLDIANKILVAGKHKISYDYVVMSQGATANFYDIEGVQQFALVLQSTRDALLIRNRVEQILTEFKYNKSQPQLDFMVVGAGLAGVELAAELQGMLSFLCWQNNIPRQKVVTTLLERSETILPGFPQAVILATKERLKELGIRQLTNTAITKVTKRYIHTNNQEQLSYDAIVWTAGVKSVSIPVENNGDIKQTKSRTEVDGCFRLPLNKNVFVIGDQCCFHDEEGQPLPGTANQAVDQGKYVASALISLLRNQTPAPYTCKKFPTIITVGQKWAIYVGQRFMLTGYLAYLVRELGWFRYYWSLLGFGQGLRWLRRSEKLYSRND